MTRSLLPPERAARLMTEVVALSSARVNAGGAPFAASVVTPDGAVLGSGVNTVIEDNDPTAHAEVCAIRDACARHDRTSLSGTVLLASGEPCAMCYVSALFSGVSEIIYAVSASQAEGYGYNYGTAYRILAGFPDEFPIPIRQISVPTALHPFDLHGSVSRRPRS